MTTYADPKRCPDCRALLPQGPTTCPVCRLPLTGQTAGELFATFQQADRLLAVLRAARQPAPATSVGATVGGGTLLDGADAVPDRAAPDPSPDPAGSAAPRCRRSCSPSGALCLLVAAVTFLAVAWAWLGVSGRTLVLVGLTGTSFALHAAHLHRRDLRTASEALSVVALGLLALDVVGARHAGWLGDVDDARVVAAHRCGGHDRCPAPARRHRAPSARRAGPDRSAGRAGRRHRRPGRRRLAGPDARHRLRPAGAWSGSARCCRARRCRWPRSCSPCCPGPTSSPTGFGTRPGGPDRAPTSGGTAPRGRSSRPSYSRPAAGVVSGLSPCSTRPGVAVAALLAGYVVTLAGPRQRATARRGLAARASPRSGPRCRPRARRPGGCRPPSRRSAPRWRPSPAS